MPRLEAEPEPSLSNDSKLVDPKLRVEQWSEEVQGLLVHGLVVVFTGMFFVWVGDSSKAMPNLAMGAANKFSPVPAISMLQGATSANASGESGGGELAEAFTQHMAKKLGAGTMVLASYQLPAEPKALHAEVQSKVLAKLLELRKN